MDDTTIQRYQLGGDIYNSLVQLYGVNVANSAAGAALTGDETQVNAVLASAPKYGPPLSTSTTAIFTNQMLTDPLAAPLAGVNNLVKNSALSFLNNPWVIAGLIIAAFFMLGGANVLRKLIGKLG